MKETESNLLQTRTELAELSVSQREAQQRLKALTLENTRLDDTLAICLGKNERLYQFGRDLISQVEKPAGFSGVLRADLYPD